jgi:hypothetical protein
VLRIARQKESVIEPSKCKKFIAVATLQSRVLDSGMFGSRTVIAFPRY